MAPGPTRPAPHRSGGRAPAPSPVRCAHHSWCARLTLGYFRAPTRHKGLLAALSRHLEDSAAAANGPVTVLATFQHARNFTPAVAERFSALASIHPHAFVVALGVDMPPRPAPHVHGTSITPGEPLAQEWTITVTAPHYFGALIAHELPSPATDSDIGRRYAYTFTHDRPLVTAAARTLMRRIHRANTPPPAPLMTPIGRFLGFRVGHGRCASRPYVGRSATISSSYRQHRPPLTVAELVLRLPGFVRGRGGRRRHRRCTGTRVVAVHDSRAHGLD
ncbi:MAG: hypothetical protein C0482_29180 [Gordonia sp.]|nr:hypothetical protein [Gordonia sp. (in: high G+C Gram-positive bacteria)]